MELYPDYHAARPPVPDDLAWQFEQAPDFFAAFGWSSLSRETLEADDLLGSLAAGRRPRPAGETLILTGDRDMYQCATEQVNVLYLKSGTTGFEAVDPAEVRTPLRDRARAGARLHRAARRPVGRAARRARGSGRRPRPTC